MDLFIFALVYLLGMAGLIFVLLFGEMPVFKGTPIAMLHWVVTQGVFVWTETVVSKCCGSRGVRVMDGAYELCCERSNPTLQVAYLALVLGGFYLYWVNLFELLPNAWVDEGHILSGSAIVATCLVFFAWASAADPGRVTAASAELYGTLYPCDDAIFPNKECYTCSFDRPARSKHCAVCRRCVARFDHHCGWINNCVGFLNMRIFLAFLAANAAMCVYGAILAGLILGGEMEQRGMLDVKLMNYKTGQVISLWQHPPKLVEWLVVYYPVPMALMLFMAIATLLMSVFLGYQMYLFAIGRTQYEQFKWRDLYSMMAERQEMELEEQERTEDEAEARQQQEQQQRPGGSAAAAQGAAASQNALVNNTSGADRTNHGAAASTTIDSSSKSSSSKGGGSGGGVSRGGGGDGGALGRVVASLPWWLGGGRRHGGRRRRRLPRPPIRLPPNIYHKGFFRNLMEVLFPEYYLLLAQRQLAAARAAGGGSGQQTQGQVQGREQELDVAPREVRRSKKKGQ